jgi:hypothetical protein
MQATDTKSKYFRSVKGTFQFAAWTIKPNVDKYDLGAIWELNDIKDDEYVRISAADQKVLFGSVVIGKKAVTLRKGRFEVVWSQAFGQDYEVQDLFNHIAYVTAK